MNCHDDVDHPSPETWKEMCEHQYWPIKYLRWLKTCARCRQLFFPQGGFLAPEYDIHIRKVHLFNEYFSGKELEDIVWGRDTTSFIAEAVMVNA